MLGERDSGGNALRVVFKLPNPTIKLLHGKTCAAKIFKTRKKQDVNNNKDIGNGTRAKQQDTQQNTHTHTHPYNSNNYRKKNLTEPKTNSSLKKAKTAKEKKKNR